MSAEDVTPLTPLQEYERKALCGDRDAVLRVVSALRGYRQLFERLRASRYSDGEVDGATMYSALSDASELEGGQ